jgi:hypothetical protein
LLQQIYLQRSSKRIRLIPVAPKDGAGTYFDAAVVDHSDDQDLNSNLVHRIIMPKNFKILPTVVGTLLFSDKPTFVDRTIACM